MRHRIQKITVQLSFVCVLLVLITAAFMMAQVSKTVQLMHERTASTIHSHLVQSAGDMWAHLDYLENNIYADVISEDNYKSIGLIRDHNRYQIIRNLLIFNTRNS